MRKVLVIVAVCCLMNIIAVWNIDQYKEIKDMIFRSIPFNALRYHLTLQVGSTLVEDEITFLSVGWVVGRIM